jgi:hypothetical protein
MSPCPAYRADARRSQAFRRWPSAGRRETPIWCAVARVLRLPLCGYAGRTHSADRRIGRMFGELF